MASIKLWEVGVNLRVHKSVSRIGLIRSDYYTTSIFRSIGWDFAPDPTGAVADPGEAEGAAAPYSSM